MDINKSLEEQQAELNAKYLQVVSVLPRRQVVCNEDNFVLAQCKRETFHVRVKWLHIQVWLPSEFLPICIIGYSNFQELWHIE